MSYILQNVILTRPVTGFTALNLLPPTVVKDFWDLIDAAIRVIDRAKADQLLTRGEEQDCRDELKDLLDHALKLSNKALDLAAIQKQELEKELNERKTEEHLKEVLLNGYFNEIIRLMTRIVNYSQGILDSYDEHPVFVMDFNVLLNTVERLTGYVPDVPDVPDVPERTYAPSAPKIKALNQNPADQDIMFLLKAIAGEVSTWFDRKNLFSEFNLLIDAPTSADKVKDGGRDSAETQFYISKVWSGAYSSEVNELLNWQNNAWKDQALNPKRKVPQEFTQLSSLDNSSEKLNPSQNEDQNQLKLIKAIWQDNEEQEIWFYVNGVATDHWVAQLNAEHLADTFKRPINILHNPTEGLYRDLSECVNGRVKDKRLDITTRLRGELESLVKGKDNAKIVVVAHSQGTIITADILKELRDDKSPLLNRMEIFNFAFCADELPEEGWRHLEHFVNENDFVPSLSVVPDNYYNIPGRIFRRPSAWGHFLGAHYLEGFKRGDYKDQSDDYRSVLYRYLGGNHYGVLST